MIVTPSEEKGIFKVSLTTVIQLITIEKIETFDNIDINVEKLEITGLTSLGISDVSIQVHPDPEKRYMVIRADFEQKLSKKKDKYKAIYQAAISEQPIDSECIKPFESKFSHLVNNLLRYIIWRKNISTNIYFQSSNVPSSHRWQIDSIEGRVIDEEPKWHIIGEPIDVEVAEPTLAEADFEDFYKLYRPSEIAVPLHKELLFEAEALLRTNQVRSSIVLICAAMEVGTKSLISHLVPNVDWLLENMPSPDLYKLHTEYIPELIGNALITESDKDLLKNLVFLRNKIVHTGKSAEYSSVKKYYFFVKRLLYKIDNHMNFPWAAEVQFPSVDFFLNLS